MKTLHKNATWRDFCISKITKEDFSTPVKYVNYLQIILEDTIYSDNQKAEAAYRLALLYRDGRFVSRNLEKGWKLLKYASSLENQKAKREIIENWRKWN